ncbi:MAG: DUF1080 domain-containing protein [Verrucomicrobia bacterium]|nr:DUF1080 domain-containing protein [Verrucomicrobiota bacterium]
MQTLRRSAVALCGMCLAITGGHAAEPELVYAKDGSGVYGHKDTPKLPWCNYVVHDPDRPAPKRVNPGLALPPAPPPSDAIVLFDGKDVSQWRSNSWRVVDGCFETSGNVTPRTKEQFGSFQLHLEWLPPAKFDGPWYNRGNNGVSIHGLYEIQIYGGTGHRALPRPVKISEGPIALSGHGCPVRFRNIWIRRL